MKTYSLEDYKRAVVGMARCETSMYDTSCEQTRQSFVGDDMVVGEVRLLNTRSELFNKLLDRDYKVDVRVLRALENLAVVCHRYQIHDVENTKKTNEYYPRKNFREIVEDFKSGKWEVEFIRYGWHVTKSFDCDFVPTPTKYEFFNYFRGTVDEVYDYMVNTVLIKTTTKSEKSPMWFIPAEKNDLYNIKKELETRDEWDLTVKSIEDFHNGLNISDCRRMCIRVEIIHLKIGDNLQYIKSWSNFIKSTRMPDKQSSGHHYHFVVNEADIQNTTSLWNDIWEATVKHQMCMFSEDSYVND